MKENISEELNIYQKLAKIRKQVEVMQRNKSGYGYKYVGEDDILAKITGLMDKYELSLIPGIVQGTINVAPYTTKKTKVAKNGDIYEENVNEVLVSADMVFSWIDNKCPENRIVIPWALVGHQSDASQSFGSGLTYSDRYFLLKYFNVATPNDDPDKWRGKQAEAEAADDKIIAEEIIKRVDEKIKAYIDKNPNKAEDVKKLASKYAKNGNYFAITDSVLASKLLKDVEDNYGMKG